VVQLEEYAANATVTLDATAADAGEQSFTLLLNGAGDVAFIEAATVTTNVMANGANVFVNLEANTAPVSAQGNSTTHFNLGGPTADGLTTAGIQANVNVTGVGLLLVDDVDNNSVQENVKVTPTTISGTGLFGTTSTVLHALHTDVKAVPIISGIFNFSPELQYSGVGKIQIFTGQEFEKYSVGGANFTTPIEIDGSAKGGLDIAVGVVATSNLHMVVNNGGHNAATLSFVAAAGSTVNVPPFQENGLPDLSGSEVAIFANEPESVVSYTNFSNVLAIGTNYIGGGGRGHLEAVLSAVATELTALKMK
jgi:hypothetical protein